MELPPSTELTTTQSETLPPPSFDELPLYELLDHPLHEMSEAQQNDFVASLRQRRVNSHVLVTHIQGEAVKTRIAKAPAKPKSVDLSFLDDL